MPSRVTSRGFTLLEVLVAFTVSMLGMAVFYASFSSLMINLNKQDRAEDLSHLSRGVYIGVYRDANIVVRGVLKEKGLDCVQLVLGKDEVIRCPYLVFIREGIWVPTNAYQVKVGDSWYLLPRVE